MGLETDSHTCFQPHILQLSPLNPISPSFRRGLGGGCLISLNRTHAPTGVAVAEVILHADAV